MRWMLVRTSVMCCPPSMLLLAGLGTEQPAETIA
jgi:hypothetical protein